jgi:AcrR family transcriptional regulator
MPEAPSPPPSSPIASDPAARRARGRPRSSAADDAIMSAALALFTERGLEGMAIEQIAQRAGVSRTTVYRRWDTKEQLLVEALGQVREGSGRSAEQWAAIDADTLIGVMLDEVPHILANPDLERLNLRLMGSARSHPELIKAYWEGHLAPQRAAFNISIAAMKAAGRLPAHLNPEVFQDIISGALTYRSLLTQTPLSAHEWRSYLRDLLRAVGLSSPRLQDDAA